MPDVADRAHHAADAVRKQRWPRWIGRAGLAARAVMYTVFALICVQLAFGKSQAEADRQGALEGLARQPFGRGMLVVLAAGFLAYALWRLLRAAIGPGDDDGDEHGGSVPQRLLDLARAGVYLSLLWSTVDVVRDGAASGGGGEQKAQQAQPLLTHPVGRWAILAVGLALIGAGAVLVVRSCREQLEGELDTSRLSKRERELYPKIGLVGYASRGVVACILGAFLAHAAITVDQSEAVGLDGALSRLAAPAAGQALLAAVSIGLFAFAARSAIEARYRPVLGDGSRSRASGSS